MVFRQTYIVDEPRRRAALERLRQLVASRGHDASHDRRDDLPEWTADDDRTTEAWFFGTPAPPVDDGD